MHLTDDQIEAMLRTASSESASDRETTETAKIHLKTCARCQSALRSHEEVMEQLALLKSTSPGAPGDCPPDAVWNQLAAKIATVDSERYLDHAARCEHCGTMLREAIADFTDELTPGEVTLIAGLGTSMPEWQGRFAAQLRDSEFPAAVSHRGDRWRSFALAILKPAPLALAAALVLPLLLGIQTRQWKNHADAQLAEASAEILRLQQDNVQQRSRISQLTAQLGTTNVSVSPMERHAEGVAASFVLEPGLTRGAGELKRMKVPHGARFVGITLRFTQPPSGVLSRELLTTDRQPIWSEESRPSVDELRDGNLLLMVPAHLLSAGDYQIVLSWQFNGRSEEVATYAFRVTR